MPSASHFSDAQRLSSPGRKQQSEAALFAAPVQLTVGRHASLTLTSAQAVN
jgi:hypothetical protein